MVFITDSNESITTLIEEGVCLQCGYNFKEDLTNMFKRCPKCGLCL